MNAIEISGRRIAAGLPTYFIADIAANHDGDLDRAIGLIHLAAKAGADAAKFQHFRAETIVSQHGFDTMRAQMSHQAKWKKSVFEVYQSASVPWHWTEALKQACDNAGIHFFSAPYELEAVDMLDPFVPAYKVGSGDITWIEALQHMASKGKPVLLATGASDLLDVQRAVDAVQALNPQVLLMQCNTNYTGNVENFKYVRLRVLETFKAMYPGMPLGLSDHTPGHAAVLGAVTLGACAIEKHFTDDTTRTGPDHPFSLDAKGWRAMVDDTRALEYALGDGNKQVEENERDTVVIQRRCLRARVDLDAGKILERSDLAILRPAPRDGIFPYDLARVVGSRLRIGIKAGEHFTVRHLD